MQGSKEEAHTLKRVCEWAQEAPRRVNSWLSDQGKDGMRPFQVELTCDSLVMEYLTEGETEAEE